MGKDNSKMYMYMPISLLLNLRDIEEIKETHRDLVFFYMFIIGILWKHGFYAERRLRLSDIKVILGYSKDDKRTNYLFKEGGVLDRNKLTRVSSNPPYTFEYVNGAIVHNYVKSCPDEDMKEIMMSNIKNCKIKSPLYYELQTKRDLTNTILVKLDTVNKIMDSVESKKVGISVVYIYYILRYMSLVNNEEAFKCSNDTLCEFSGLGLRKVIKITNHLADIGFLQKSQEHLSSGNVNCYTLTRNL